MSGGVHAHTELVRRYESACYLKSRRQLLPWNYFRVARDPLETGGECSDRLLHCEDRAEPGRSLDNALISLRSFGQRVGLDYRFNFSLGYVI